VKFLAYSPAVSPSDAHTVVEYIHARKYAPQRVADVDGFATDGPPLQPTFSMRTRKARALLRKARRWRRRQQRDRWMHAEEWEPSGLRGLEVAQHVDGERITWRMRELLSRAGLLEEGKRMGHCVGTNPDYIRSCKYGTRSIWSLQGADSDGKCVHAMTIALNNRTRVVREARGRRNAALKEVASDDPRRLSLRRCHDVIDRWAAGQGISSPAH
jgi:hypothetical protein